MRATGAGSKTPPWIKELRSLIKRQHGVVWGIGEQSGKCKLTRRYPDGGRSSVVLPLAWQSSSTTEILSQLQAIRSRMENGGMSFNEAASLETKSDLVIKATMDWTLILEKFQKYKTSDTGAVKEETFLRMYRPNLLQLVSVVSCRPMPQVITYSA